MTDKYVHGRPSLSTSRTGLAALMFVAATASACTDSPSRLANGGAVASNAPTGPTVPSIASRSDARADSLAMGYFKPRSASRGLNPNAILMDAISDGTAAIVSVTPGWFQGSAQPLPITVVVSGPVSSVTIKSGTYGDAILCSGSYGTLIAYNSAGVVVASAPLTLISEPDCGVDQVTFGATATVTSAPGDIAKFVITPMSPVDFPVLGMPGGKASATYKAQLQVVPGTNAPPVANFNNACFVATFVCTFDASASSDDQGIVSYSWDFNKYPDGTGTGKIVNTTYSHAGWRTVTLTVTDAQGRKGSLTQTILLGSFPPPPPMNFAPVAAFTANCVNLVCTFDSSISTDDVGIVTRSWNFGDGTAIGGVIAPKHTYPAAGTYSVTLGVVDGGGAGTNLTKVITLTVPPVDAPPVPRFTWSCLTRTCTFNASTSSDDKGIVSYAWDLNKYPGGSAAGVAATTTYPHSGIRNVKLTVTDAIGQKASITQAILIP